MNHPHQFHFVFEENFTLKFLNLVQFTSKFLLTQSFIMFTRIIAFLRQFEVPNNFIESSIHFEINARFFLITSQQFITADFETFDLDYFTVRSIQELSHNIMLYFFLRIS